LLACAARGLHAFERGKLRSARREAADFQDGDRLGGTIVEQCAPERRGGGPWRDRIDAQRAAAPAAAQEREGRRCVGTGGVEQDDALTEGASGGRGCRR